ncbi:hypothetical protein BS78_04G084000 [Paspalum vaginatum]|nr:hypothetical protein BS78_04G084000 [Paspalum vaginatum]
MKHCTNLAITNLEASDSPVWAQPGGEIPPIAWGGMPAWMTTPPSFWRERPAQQHHHRLQRHTLESFSSTPRVCIIRSSTVQLRYYFLLLLTSTIVRLLYL